MDPKLFSRKVSEYTRASEMLSKAAEAFLRRSSPDTFCQWGDIREYRSFAQAMKMPSSSIPLDLWLESNGWERNGDGFKFKITSPDSGNAEDPIQETVHVNTVLDIFNARNRIDKAILNLYAEAESMSGSTVTLDSKRVSGDLIIGDPCRIIPRETGEYDKFIESNCKESPAVGFSDEGKAVCAPTGFGDGWFSLLSSCPAASTKASKVEMRNVGGYTVDSGMHGAFPLKTVLDSNPSLSSNLQTMVKNRDVAVLKNFTGTVSIEMTPEGDTRLHFQSENGDSLITKEVE